MPGPTINIKALGQVDYLSIYQAMQAFTQTRDENTPDEPGCANTCCFHTGISWQARALLAPHPDIPVLTRS